MDVWKRTIVETFSLSARNTTIIMANVYKKEQTMYG